MSTELAVPADSDRVRRPRSVFSVGEEPDVRFSLANERTALAWVRTALALVAGGITLTTVAGISSLAPTLYGLAALSCAAGAVLAVVALRRWAENERALRRRAPLPAPVSLAWLVVGVVIASSGLGVLAAVQWFGA
ncbi:YidH family protein [Nocardia neocaledoniensis]|uniref:YidH family protein n=1 Tax=Nocardia neocaledoniensis TaxID=236511 RepID=UPI002456BFB4|nr:DUF202 domain-containing protein [Nocardia neocaledoniensis]